MHFRGGDAKDFCVGCSLAAGHDRSDVAGGFSQRMDRSVENSPVYHAALRKAGVPVEMNLYAHGGHAVGLRHKKFPERGWRPQLVETWLRTIAMIAEQVLELHTTR